jgi:hypothetical protein
MAFPTDEIIWGPPAYGPRKGTEMVVFHTTEGSGPSRESALGTIKLQSPGGSLYAGGGSYHWYIYDGGLIQCVGYTDSAGSLTANHTPPPAGVWAPKDWVKGFLSPAAQADTNAYVIAVAFSGKAADLAAGKYPASMIDTAARLVRWIEQQSWAPDNIPVAGHADFQTNRSDPGAGVVDKILARYAELYNPPDYKALYEAEKAKTADLTSQLEAEKAKSAAAHRAGFVDAKTKAVVAVQGIKP